MTESLDKIETDQVAPAAIHTEAEPAPTTTYLSERDAAELQGWLNVTDESLLARIGITVDIVPERHMLDY